MKVTGIQLTRVAYPMPFNLRWGRGKQFGPHNA